jgi:hypothetical protein
MQRQSICHLLLNSCAENTIIRSIYIFWIQTSQIPTLKLHSTNLLLLRLFMVGERIGNEYLSDFALVCIYSQHKSTSNHAKTLCIFAKPRFKPK